MDAVNAVCSITPSVILCIGCVGMVLPVIVTLMLFALVSYIVVLYNHGVFVVIAYTCVGISSVSYAYAVATVSCCEHCRTSVRRMHNNIITPTLIKHTADTIADMTSNQHNSTNVNSVTKTTTANTTPHNTTQRT